MRKSISILSITIILVAGSSACFPKPSSRPVLPMDRFTPEPVSLETLPTTKLEFYEDDYSVIIFDASTLVNVVEDSVIINQWNSILENNCQTYYPNHPSYEETLNVIGASEEGDLKYILRIDSDDNDVDVYPIRHEVEQKTIYELGRYRCEGLMEFLDEFVLTK